MTRNDRDNGCEFEGALTLDDFARHVPHGFDVPEGAAALRVRFEHSAASPPEGDVPHQLSISVYGPAGARGTRHNNADQSVVLSADFASPGYLAGPIEGGRWTVEIDVHRILPPGLIRYRIAVEWGAAAPAFSSRAVSAAGPRGKSGPGWFRGDLHGHSLHSDAGWSVAEFAADAERRGLDFAFLTDHNTVSGLRDLPAAHQGTVSVFAGMELTTFFGHGLALGADRNVEWRIKDGDTMAARVKDIQTQGMLFVIAHPMVRGHPWCTGCTWQYSDVYPGPATHVEVWHRSQSFPHNGHALQLYYGWLCRGHRLFATCGSDTHRPGERDRAGYNCVFAQALTQREILAALEQGQSYLSSGPELGFEAHTKNCGPFKMGQTAPSPITSVTVRARHAPPGSTLRLLTASPGNGGARVAREAGLTEDTTLELEHAGSDWKTFLIAEIRDANRQLCALSNPIFLIHETQDSN